MRQFVLHCKSGFLRRSLSITGLAIFLITTVFADQAEDCHSLYKTIAARQTQQVGTLLAGSNEYFQHINTLENDIFAALEQCPQDPLLFTLMAENQIAHQNFQLASIYAKRAYQQHPDIWQTNHTLGTALFMLKQYKKGLVLLDKAVKLAPQKPVLLFNLCSSLVAASHHEKAVTICSKLLKQKSHQMHRSAYQQRSLAYRALGKTKLADSDLQNAQHKSGN